MSKLVANRFGLTERDLDTIYSIFERYPEVAEVRIFGSRAKGTHKKGSDIDFAIMNPGVSHLTISRIKSDFSESSLPYRVDVVDFTKLEDADLKSHIERVGEGFYTSSE